LLKKLKKERPLEPNPEKKAPSGPTEEDKDALVRRRRGEALGLGYTIAGGMAFFSWIGYMVDKKRGTGPFWTVVGMFMGLIFGGYEVWKLTRLYNRDGEG